MPASSRVSCTGLWWAAGGRTTSELVALVQPCYGVHGRVGESTRPCHRRVLGRFLHRILQSVLVSTRYVIHVCLSAASHNCAAPQTPASSVSHDGLAAA